MKLKGPKASRGATGQPKRTDKQQVSLDIVKIETDFQNLQGQRKEKGEEGRERKTKAD